MKTRRYSLTKDKATTIMTAIEIAVMELRNHATNSPYNNFLKRELTEIYNELKNYEWRKLK